MHYEGNAQFELTGSLGRYEVGRPPVVQRNVSLALVVSPSLLCSRTNVVEQRVLLRLFRAVSVLGVAASDEDAGTTGGPFPNKFHGLPPPRFRMILGASADRV